MVLPVSKSLTRLSKREEYPSEKEVGFNSYKPVPGGPWIIVRRRVKAAPIAESCGALNWGKIC